MISNMPTSSDEAKSHINVNSTEASSMTDSEKCIPYNDVKEVTAGSSSTLVTWDGPNDPQCPQNWSNARKLPAVLSICSIAFSTSFSSSVFAPAAVPVAAEFGVSNTIATLGVSLYVLGFAAGKIIPARSDRRRYLIPYNRTIALGPALGSFWQNQAIVRRSAPVCCIPDTSSSVEKHR